MAYVDLGAIHLNTSGVLVLKHKIAVVSTDVKPAKVKNYSGSGSG